MLTLNQEQWSQLKARDGATFAAAVCDQFLSTRPEMSASPGRQVVLTRMVAAQNYALRAGFVSTPHIVHLMYLSADAPAIHDDPVVDAHLRRKGATPEQRLDDLLAVVAADLRQLEEGK